MQHRKTAFLCRRFPASIESALAQRYELRTNPSDRILSTGEFLERAADCEIVLATATERLSAETIRSLPRLEVVATLSVGLDHIDLAQCRDSGVQVLYTPGVLDDACAEIAMLLVLNACRRGHEADRLVRSGRWAGWAPTQLLGMGLTGRRLGIFGMGRIGQAVAQRARPFGVSIQYHNRNRLDPELEGDAVYHESLEGLLACSDVLVLTAAGSPELRHVLDVRRFSLLPRGAVVVNISRGDLIDDDALVHGLQTGAISAAGLDVFANEPDLHPGYRDLDNVFLTPHIGSATTQTREAMGWLLINGLDALAREERPANLVTDN